MLDRIGYKGPEIIGKRILDLSCGSGGFLVEAAHRLVDAHRQHWRKSGHSHVPADRVQGVLDSIRASLHGVDLNPFACALAETNLLIQVIDLFAIAYDKGEPASIDRFHIYSGDSLTFSDETLGHLDGSLPFPAEDLPVADCLKAGIGPWEDKFDYVVGNPPYVRADEGALGLKEFRDRVKREYPVQSVRDVLTKKWDLFVPFVAASQALLKPRSPYAEPGKAALITSNAIETVPYAESLRRHLVDTVKIEEIHFFEGVKLFEDAAVFNTITVIENDPPSPQHHVTRYWHEEAPKWGSHGRSKSQSLRQGGYGTEVFRQRLPAIDFAPGLTTVALDDVFYISVGMVLNANEKTNKGEFVLDDLIADARDDRHPAPYVGGKDIGDYGCLRVRYLEYGPDTRVPAQIRRPTFPELYDRPKMMIGRFGGVTFDDGAWSDDGYLKCNHTVMLLMPWHHLEGVANKSIQNEVKSKGAPREALEAMSRGIDPWYLLAYLNSRQIDDMLEAVASSGIRGETQPDDLRQIRIPLPDAKLAGDVAALAREAVDMQRELLPLRMAGWRIEDGEVIAPAVIPDAIPRLDFASACVKWGLTIQNEQAKSKGLTRTQHRLFAGKREVLAAPSATVPEGAVEWLRRQFDHLPGDLTMEQVQRNGVMVPSTPQAAVAALAEIDAAETIVRAKAARIAEIREQISETMEALFVRTNHPPIK